MHRCPLLRLPSVGSRTAVTMRPAMARPKRRIDKTTCTQVAALRAEGLSQKKIGQALGMSSDTVRGVLRLPQTQADYVRAREIIGVRVLEHVASFKIRPGSWPRTALLEETRRASLTPYRTF